MDVFLVPVGREAYELYCEHVEEPEVPVTEPPSGFWARLNPAYLFNRLKSGFHQVLIEAERERRRETALAGNGTRLQRLKRRVMRWVAESIAEQRLLWNLRSHYDATLHYPHDMSEEAADALVKRQLTRDFEKHRKWLAVHSVLLLLSALLILVPGPNFIGYYFAFRVVGHLFSVRGARSGLDRVRWTKRASTHLSDLRQALSMDPAGRLRVAESVASHLRLDHLATFFQRTAVPS